MLLVIAGAGASYDSSLTHRPQVNRQGDESINRLPLADQLFEDRVIFQSALDKYPHIKPLLPNLRHRAAGRSVEQALEELSIEADTYAQTYRELAAIRFYLQESIWQTYMTWNTIHHGSHNYAALVNQIDRYKPAGELIHFVTFNYDLLIEDALRSVRAPIKDINDYVQCDHYKLFKLHGSVNWVHHVSDAHWNAGALGYVQAATVVIDHFEVVKEDVDPSISIIDNLHSGTPENRGYLPALAIPLQKKHMFECPDQHIAELRALLPHVDKILVVGWRGSEAHFVNLLSEFISPKTRILIANENNAAGDETINALRTSGVHGVYKAVDTPFSQFILDYRVREFIRS